MKRLLGVLVALLVIALIVDSYTNDRDDQTLVASNRQFLREGDSLRRIIQEHADSARAIQPRIEWRERVVTRLVERIDTLHVRADILADSGHWQQAYELRTQEADTLRLALSVATNRGDDAITMASYWQLAYIADSSRREEAEQRLAHTTNALAKRTKWYARLGVSVGVDISGKPNAMIGFKAWP